MFTAVNAQACGSCLVEEIAFDNPIGIIGALDGGWDAEEPTITVERVLRNEVEGLDLNTGDQLRLPGFDHRQHAVAH